MERIEAEARSLLADAGEIRPPGHGHDVVESFIARINGVKVAASAERIGCASALPEYLARWLARRALPPRLRVQPIAALESLDWAGAQLSTDGELDDGVVVTMARWGIAETGSLVAHSGRDTPVLYHFLPAVDIIAVPAEALVWHLEDYFRAARQVGDPAPRNACLITGASGTTDIEGHLVTGAHGPRLLHIVVIDARTDRAPPA